MVLAHFNTDGGGGDKYGLTAIAIAYMMKTARVSFCDHDELTAYRFLIRILTAYVRKTARVFVKAPTRICQCSAAYLGDAVRHSPRNLKTFHIGGVDVSTIYY